MLLIRAAAVAILAGKSAACVVAHCYQQRCPFTGDITEVQIWDNGRLVCFGAQTKYFTSPDDQYNNIECFEPGIGANVTSGCGGISYRSGAPDYYETNLRYIYDDTDKSRQERVGCCTGCDCDEADCPPMIMSTDTEAVFWDDDASCANVNKPELCDYRDYCPSYQPSGSAVYEGTAPPFSDPNCVPAGAPVEGPVGEGSYGLKYVNDCDPNRDPYATFDNKDHECMNTVSDDPWDSIILTRTGGMQIQMFANRDCDPCGGCLAINSDQAGDVDAPGTCQRNIGTHSGVGFMKSWRAVINGTAPGECAVV